MASTKKVSNNVIAAILYILLGVLFIVFKAGMLNWLMTIVGIVFIALGVYNIIQRRLTNGIIEAVIGVVVILGGWLFVEIVLIVLGALLVVKPHRAVQRQQRRNGHHRCRTYDYPRHPADCQQMGNA